MRFVACLLLLPYLSPCGSAQVSEPRTVFAVAECTLESANGKIRQFAFDGDAQSYYASATNATAADAFTLIFDAPVAVRSIAVKTGRPKGEDQLDNGQLAISADGKSFEAVAKFGSGEARADVKNMMVSAMRIMAAADLSHPLVIREIEIDSRPKVMAFKYPIEFKIDVSNAPEMKDWAAKAARICERQYYMINEELKSDGHKPRSEIMITLSGKYKGVAAAGGGSITGSVDYFKTHPDDFGAMVHETVHCVQDYRVRHNPGWLVEGVADYIRFFKYEPGKIGPLRAERAKYNGSYRVTAAFLNYVAEKYDKDLVRKLNQAMREGEYKDDLFKQLTKKSLVELDEEWRAGLVK